jgi:DNA transposition AAA+ family ATPase
MRTNEEMTVPTAVAPGTEQTTRLPAQSEISLSEIGRAAGAQNTVGVALNVNVWSPLVRAGKITSEDVDELVWLHQFATEENRSRKEIGEAIGYDETTVFRILKGTYEGSWVNVIAPIRKYRMLIQRERAKTSEFRKNSIAELVWGGLDYALANNSITLIIGESRTGKSVSAGAWRDDHNHGRSVLMSAPAMCSRLNFLRRLCTSIGASKSQNIYDQESAVMRAFSPSRILIVDEAHRIVEGRHQNQAILEFLRDVHDQTGCALALIATARFKEAVRRTEYMYEQFEGRIGMPVRLQRKMEYDDIAPILVQYVPNPSQWVKDEAVAIANRPGRLGILVETLKFASKIARQQNATIVTEKHVKSAVATRTKMMGEQVFAQK